MESRGNATDAGLNNRPAIARRSCDQCRSRKIGCDRGSPCSNCLSARVDCTHSAVSSKPTTARQRVLISAQYEKKIDDIARDVKSLLESRRITPDEPTIATIGTPAKASPYAIKQPTSIRSSPASSVTFGRWEHSAHVIDFVKAVVEEDDSTQRDSSSSPIVSSLRNLVDALENTDGARITSISEATPLQDPESLAMPPLEAVVAILRWAKAHQRFYRVTWICTLLPYEKFEEICRKVYFAVDDYTEADLIVANSFLSHMFTEYAAIYGDSSFKEYAQLCGSKLDGLLSRLPIFLPATLEVIAALALGSMHLVEQSKTLKSWTLISAALNLCQTAGYHRLGLARDRRGSSRIAEERLFWTVYSLENGLALRLGRCSSIHDADIMLPVHSDEPKPVKIARIRAKVYEHLYSPGAMAAPTNERVQAALRLSRELRELNDDTKAEISSTTRQPEDTETDTMRIVYLQCSLVCNTSFLVQILRAIPLGYTPDPKDNYIIAARETLDLHQECMQFILACKDPFLITRYIVWALMHTPFVPFSVLFANAVQSFDRNDLYRIEKFAASLKPETEETGSSTHPHRLYELLSQAARLYLDSNNVSSMPTSTETEVPDIYKTAPFPVSSEHVDDASDIATGGLGPLEEGDFSMTEFSDWYYGNQQLMNLLDGDVQF